MSEPELIQIGLFTVHQETLHGRPAAFMPPERKRGSVPRWGFDADEGLPDPIECTPTRGGRVADSPLCGGLWTVWHERVYDALRENGITGWDCRPVILHQKKGSPLTDYSRLVLTGREPRLGKAHARRTPNDLLAPLWVTCSIASPEHAEPPLPAFDLWPVEGTWCIGASRKAARVLTDGKFTGIIIEPLPLVQFGWPVAEY